MKTAILRRYNINELSNQAGGRVSTGANDTPREFSIPLDEGGSATPRVTGPPAKRTVFISNMKVAVMEQQPKNCEEASQFAQNYLQAHATSLTTKTKRVPTTKCPNCGVYGLWACNCQRRDRERREEGDTCSTSGSGSTAQRPGPAGQGQRNL